MIDETTQKLFLQKDLIAKKKEENRKYRQRKAVKVAERNLQNPWCLDTVEGGTSYGSKKFTPYTHRSVLIIARG